LGTDADGKLRAIDLRVVHNQPTKVSLLGGFAQFDPRFQSGVEPVPPFIGASLEIVCHELAHLVQNTLMPGGATTASSGAVNEGIADILAAAAEAYVRGAPADAPFPCSTNADCADFWADLWCVRLHSRSRRHLLSSGR
jgi:hypothetical protein